MISFSDYKENYELVGRKVYSKLTNKNLKLLTDSHGYYYVTLRLNGKSRNVRYHRILAEENIPNPDNLPYVDHIDGDKKNNKLDNLQWIDHRTNIAKTNKVRGVSKYKGVYFNKKNNTWIAHIRNNYKRVHIGSFKTEEDAAFAYQDKYKEIYGR